MAEHQQALSADDWSLFAEDAGPQAAEAQRLQPLAESGAIAPVGARSMCFEEQ